jgi:hypothetical protein
MRKTLLFVILAAAAGLAQAQIKCWNEGGKRVCGDAPPAGAKVTTLKAPAGPAPAPAGKDAASKDARKGPMTPAEREQDYRKRQLEAKKAADKSADEQKLAEAKKDNCERAREALRNLESGQRIMRTDAKGERYYLDEAQIASEAAKARQIAQDACN